LLLMLAAYLVAAPMLWPQLDLPVHVRDAELVGLSLSHYAPDFWQRPTILSHSWSLAVEEHFYLIWPLAIVLLARIPLRWRIALLIRISIYVLARAWRIFE
jgi:peptidoglycan/LPS O-acetylase OafA/YrhL